MNDPSSTALRMTILSVLLASLLGCGTDPPQDRSNGQQFSRQAVQRNYSNQKPADFMIAKVKVLSNGDILLDEKKTALDELRSALVAVRDNTGAVWYYRESDSAESSDEHRAVMDIITDEGLPTKYSTKPDFSNSVPPFDY